MITVSLPWPSSVLSPNHRGHWAPKARAVKLARMNAAWIVKAVLPRKPQWAGVALDVTFCPPNKRRFDRDGLISRMKAAQDGIADAIGIDDHLFIPTYRMGNPVPNGAVLVTISEAKP